MRLLVAVPRPSDWGVAARLGEKLPTSLAGKASPLEGKRQERDSLLSRLSWSLVLLNRGARSWSSSDTNLSEVACTVQDARGISVSVAREI